MMQAVKPDAEPSLRIGVIGVGVMGSNHARVLTGLPGAELVGVADPDRKQAEFVARTLGCAAVASVNELLDLKVDAVTIAAPTHLHRDIALALSLIHIFGAGVLWAMWITHLLLFRGSGLVEWIGLVVVVQNIVGSLFNSHLFDFTQGWVYVFGVGVAGGMVLKNRAMQKPVGAAP